MKQQKPDDIPGDEAELANPDELIKLDDSNEENVLSDEVTDGLTDDEIDDIIEPEATKPAPEPKADTDESTAKPKPKHKQKVSHAQEEAVTDEVVEDIMVSEAMDESNDDTSSGIAPPAKQPKAAKSTDRSPIVAFIKKIWGNPVSRWGVIGGTFLLVLCAAAVPQSRYFILNTAQVRASLELKVIDAGTLQPLKNVRVKAGGAEAQTDSDGVAKLQKVRLGKTKLAIEKRAFAPVTKDIVVGWGSNPIGEFQVTAAGSQYVFYVKDLLSGQPIEGAEAVSGEGNARADENGKLVLTLDTAELDDAAQISVAISAAAYRNETVTITVNNRENQSVSMVPGRKHVFVSKRSGKYDVYTVDADGKNEQRVLGGTSYERDDLALIPHPHDAYVAYVATRENTRNETGYLLSTLYVIDTETGNTVKVDQSEQIQVIGWSDEGRLVYVKIAAGASGNDAQRHRLISFNNNDHTDTKELASSNSFNDVVMVNSTVYYAPSNIFQQSEPGVYSVRANGSNPQRILDKEAYTLIRTDYDTLYLSVGTDWFQYVFGSPTASASHAPGTTQSRLYIDNPAEASTRSLWVDQRDGRGVIIAYDKATKQEQLLFEKGGIKTPLYWLTDKHIVFRVADGRETADYVINIEGGEAHKITDVTDAAGITRWFYY